MTAQKKRFEFWTIISIVLLATFLLFFVYPVASLLKESVVVDGTFTLEAFQRFFTKSYYYKTIFNSFKVSLAVMAVCLVLGVPFSYFYTFYRLKGKRILFILCLLCTMSAPFIGAYSWILLLGRSGVITQLLGKIGISVGSIYGFFGILLVQSLKLFPLVVIYMNGAFQNIDNSLMEASESFGCKGVNRLCRIVMMLTMPTVLAAALLVFMRAFADFGTPILIGEGYKTFPVLIYEAFLSENGSDFNFASAVSVIAIILTGIVFLFQKFATSRFKFTINALHPVEPRTPGKISGFLMHLYCYALVAIALLPTVYIVYMSFQNYNVSVVAEGYSLGNYKAAMKKNLVRSINNTLIVSIVSLAIIIVIAVLIAYLVARRPSVMNHSIDTISMLPYIMPGAVIGIALIVGFNRPPFKLTGTLIILVVALAIRRMPFTSRSATAIIMQIPISTEEAAISLGASKLKTFLTITIPMMANGIISGAVLSFVSIITEMSSSVMLYNSRTITLTVSTYSSIVRGTYGVAAAFATVTTIFTVICLVLYLLLTKNVDDVRL